MSRAPWITPETAALVSELLGSGMTQTDIAKRAGICVESVSKINRRVLRGYVKRSRPRRNTGGIPCQQ